MVPCCGVIAGTLDMVAVLLEPLERMNNEWAVDQTLRAGERRLFTYKRPTTKLFKTLSCCLCKLAHLEFLSDPAKISDHARTKFDRYSCAWLQRTDDDEYTLEPQNYLRCPLLVYIRSRVPRPQA